MASPDADINEVVASFRDTIKTFEERLTKIDDVAGFDHISETWESWPWTVRAIRILNAQKMRYDRDGAPVGEWGINVEDENLEDAVINLGHALDHVLKHEGETLSTGTGLNRNQIRKIKVGALEWALWYISTRGSTGH